MSHAGLVPATRLAERGVRKPGRPACSGVRQGRREPGLKIGSLVAGMIAGARTSRGWTCCATERSRTRSGGSAPRDTGVVLRAFTHGNVRQLAAVHRRVLARLPRRQRCCPAPTRWRSSMSTRCKNGCSGRQTRRGVRAHQDRVEVADRARTQRAGRHGVESGCGAGNHDRSVRGGNASSARGAASLIIEAITPPGPPGPPPYRGPRRLRVLRGSVPRSLPPRRRAFLGHLRKNPQELHAIASIDEDAWTRSPTRTRSTTSRPADGSPMPRSPRCPTPPSTATAPTSPQGRLIVRRVRQLNPEATAPGPT